MARARMRTTHEKLATVLFTDIVDSTVHAARAGDAGWRDVLDRHDDLCHIEIGVSGGRWIKSTGDGLLATFDSPSRAVRCAWEFARPHPIRDSGSR